MNLTKRQKELVEAAAKLIAEKGIQGLTIKNLALEIKVTEAALYRHFPSKTEIIKAMIEYLTQNISSRLGEIVLGEGTAIERLEKVLVSQFRFFTENPEYVAVVFSEGLFRTNEDLADTVLTLLASKKKILLTLIEQCREEHSVVNNISGEDLTHVVMGGFRLLLMKWMLNNYGFDLVNEGNKYWNTIYFLIKRA